MKIVYSTDQIYLHGGVEKVMATKANWFASIPGVTVYIVTTEQEGRLPCYPLDEQIQYIDLGIGYDREQSYFSLKNLKKAILHWRRQRSAFRNINPDVIISPNFNFDHYWLPFIKGRAKLVKERHGTWFFEEKQRAGANLAGRLRFRLTDWIERRYDHIVVLNKDELQYVRTGNAVVIPNPVELQSLTALLKNKQVIAAGRISPVKNFGDLIVAWAIVQKEMPDWQLHIYGQDYGGTQDRLQEQINSLNLRHSVRFCGTTAQMTQTMTEYSIYAMTSESECFPMVLLEALSVGLPVVSYDCPNGPRNIITPDEDGLLSPHNDIEKLAQNLLMLMRDESLRQQMGAAAKDNVRRFSLHNVMKEWQNLLNLPHV